MASKRFFTSYPWSGSPFRSPSTPYLSDNLSSKHTQYVCRVCIAFAPLSRLLTDDFCRVTQSRLAGGAHEHLEVEGRNHNRVRQGGRRTGRDPGGRSDDLAIGRVEA